jgi:16S rRNA (guanine527-N7)-methyltransferase
VPPGGVIDRLAEAAARPVSRETLARLEAYVALLKGAAREQNLISASTLDSVWERHVLDSAQLVRFEPRPGASWADIGSGPGLPGIVIACVVEGPVTLIEPRRLRAEFLESTVSALDLTNRVRVEAARVERVTGSYDVITARAVAQLGKLLEISKHLSTGKTVWALPKGRSAERELAEAQQAWQGVFHVERSVTDEDSRIVVATGVRVKTR